MLQSYDLWFASSNRHKYKEAEQILSNFGIKLGFLKCELQEIQADSIKEIASHKVTEAFKKCKKPVIIEDAGLFIESLKGFPGPFSSYVFKTIGNNGILQLVGSKRKTRAARFQSVLAYCDKKNGIVLFEAIVKGMISTKSVGKGWGYDPIFIPSGKKREGKQQQTYAVLSNKNKISHRYKVLKKFSSWFLRM